jgi:hypothetical protein
VPAGAQASITATLKNLSSYDKLGSAEIAVPAALTAVIVVKAPGGSQDPAYRP